MKCPYCKIHYMDDERTCPICGRPNPSRRPVKAAVPVQKNRKAPRPSRPAARPPRPRAQPRGRPAAKNNPVISGLD